ncbi:hypothetical protein Tco_0923278 [Tanacetum coccineum]|uniref:Uncharacterized protein n=1 Tax=Tanacetum coccineum TaxID=301880 RepID=A0ABQ5D7P5_9ASTR
MNELHVRLNILRLTISPKACSFMLCDLDFEPLSLSLSSMPSCDLESLTNIFILCLIWKASCWDIQDKSLCRDSDLEDLLSFEIFPNSKKMSEAEPTPPASSVTTLLDDWSIEIDADHVNLGQDGLGVFDWSEEADNAPTVF